MSELALNHTDENNMIVEENFAPTNITVEDSAVTAESPADAISPKSATTTTKTPSKRTPKRMSFIERAQKESEELVRTMGGTLELEGGRRTRSSARGTSSRSSTDVTPPPAKKARNSPSAARGKGRGRKSETPVAATDDNEELSTIEHNIGETTPKNRKRKKSEESDDIPQADIDKDDDDDAKTKDKDIPTITVEAAKDENAESNNIDHVQEKTVQENKENVNATEEQQESNVKAEETVEKAESEVEAMEVDNATTTSNTTITDEVATPLAENKEATTEIIEAIDANEQKEVVPAAQKEITTLPSTLSENITTEISTKNGDIVHNADDITTTTKIDDCNIISNACTNNNDNVEKTASSTDINLAGGDYVKIPSEINEMKLANNLVAVDGGGEPAAPIATSCNN